jgi:hypothetical protein
MLIMVLMLINRVKIVFAIGKLALKRFLSLLKNVGF